MSRLGIVCDIPILDGYAEALQNGLALVLVNVHGAFF